MNEETAATGADAPARRQEKLGRVWIGRNGKTGNRNRIPADQKVFLLP